MSYSKNYNGNNWNSGRKKDFDLKAEPEDRYNESCRETEFVRVKQDLFADGDRSKLGWSSPSEQDPRLAHQPPLHRDWTHTPESPRAHHSYEGNERNREETFTNQRNLTPPMSAYAGSSHRSSTSPPSKRRGSVFERLSWDHRPVHKTWQNGVPEPALSTVPNRSTYGTPAAITTPAIISVPNYLFEVVNAPATAYTVPIELPCSSKIIRKFTQTACPEELLPSKYDMKVQKEIACLQKRALRYTTTNPCTVLTDDGQGVDQVYITPQSTNISLHKRFA